MKAICRILCSLCLLLCGSAFTSFAQQRINGVIKEKNSNLPVPSANVKLESDLLNSERLTNTDADGRFSFAGLSPGHYTISVSSAQFNSEQITVALAPRQVEQIEIELSPLASIKEQMSVKASAKLLDEKETATATSIDHQQIAELPAARRTQLTDLITPFVSSAVGGHDNLVHLRGNELSLNTFINGVSFFDNPHQLFTPGLAPDCIQSINVITGGFPAEFGNRFGGILDIVTRNGFDANNHGSLSIGAGSFLRHNVAIDYGGHSERFGYFFYGQAFESNRFLNTPEVDVFHDQGKGSRAFAQFDYHPGTNNSFKLLLTGGGTNFELPNTTTDELRGRDFFQRNREQTAVLSWEHIFSAASEISSSFYERYVSARLLPTNDEVSIQASGFRNDFTTGLKSDYSLYLNPRQAMKMGVDLTLLGLRENLFFDPRENEIEIGTFNFRGHKTGGQASFYFQDKITLFQNFTANVGLRYDQYNLVTSGHELSPRLNLAYAFNGGRTAIHFAYNRFFAPPPIENLLLSNELGFAGQPPRISRSNHFETGVSHSIGSKLVVRATAYWRSDKNSFETTELANVRIFAPTTFARGKAYGIEFSTQLAEIQRLGISGYLSYTAQRAFQTGPVSGGFTVENGDSAERNPTAFDQIHTGVAGLTWREHHSGFWASAALQYGSGTPASLKNEDGEEMLVRLPEHLTADFYFGIDLFRKERRNVSLQFAIENATDRVYRIAKESEFTPVQFSPPRFFSGSVKFHF